MKKRQEVHGGCKMFHTLIDSACVGKLEIDRLVMERMNIQ